MRKLIITLAVALALPVGAATASPRPLPPVPNSSVGSVYFRTVAGDANRSLSGVKITYSKGGATRTACISGGFGVCLATLPTGTYTFTAETCGYEGTLTYTVRPRILGMLQVLMPFVLNPTGATC